MIENNKCKNLVICGTNLGSTVNRFILNILNIPIKLNSIILGILISDGHLFKKKKIIHYSHLNKLLIDSIYFDLFLINFLNFVRVILQE
jgi:hypothetical protein